MQEKKLFKVSTATIVATGLGAAVFTLLFMFVKVPSPVPETQFQTAYGISGFFGALFGPVAGALTAFIGHALSDFVQYGAPWWSWVVASGLSGFFCGISYKFVHADRGELGIKGILIFNAFQIGGNLLSWLVVAPLLDILIYAEPANVVFLQGNIATWMNAISCGVIGTVLLLIYSATRPKAGSLQKSDDSQTD